MGKAGIRGKGVLIYSLWRKGGVQQVPFLISGQVLSRD